MSISWKRWPGGLSKISHVFWRMAVGRWRAVWSLLERCFGEKRFTTAGRGERARRRELLLVVARCRIFGRIVGGVVISNISSSDLSSPTKVGVLGGGDILSDLEAISGVGVGSHARGVSGAAVSSDTCRAGVIRFGSTMFS